MARRIFFSFHYDRDILRVGQVRNSGLTRPDHERRGFIDAASWESLKKQGDLAVRRWINNELDGTSVTVVLIGAETASRPWVKYEIEQSLQKRNGLLGIYIHNVRDLHGRTDAKGPNPFADFKVSGMPLSLYTKTYDWIYDDGYNHFRAWVEDAARAAGR